MDYSSVAFADAIRDGHVVDDRPLVGTLLLVRHGRGRGPRVRLSAVRPKYLDPLLADFARRDPELRSHIAVWETGTPLPDLDNVNAILFLLQDPLRERFPNCFAEAQRLAEESRRRGIRLVNPPETLSNSVKTTQARLWQAAGLPVPRHFAFHTRDEFEQALRACPFPAILRSDLLHSQLGMTFCPSEREARAAAEKNLPLPGTLVEFVDTRHGFQQAAPGSDWARYFHKKRSYVLGDIVCNNHVFFGPDPIVGSLSCTFDHYRSLNPWRRWQRNQACREHFLLDLAYFHQPPEHASTLRAAAATLGLEFVAIDYSSLADGGLVLWEANPHFCMHAWPLQVLAGPRQLAMRLDAFHRAAGAFFRQLLPTTAE